MSKEGKGRRREEKKVLHLGINIKITGKVHLSFKGGKLLFFHNQNLRSELFAEGSENEKRMERTERKDKSKETKDKNKR